MCFTISTTGIKCFGSKRLQMINSDNLKQLMGPEEHESMTEMVVVVGGGVSAGRSGAQS